ncbi:hypothetical protein ADL25_42425 [Streptomyces sp. NRRL F-5122]|uniref:hypothetical protein n=1 Tax=Streptomyces sp. NRRL F-5122 TaxID=1609098 RepID=UPI000740D142|nr:hypothetical protein [Streptomyces sp. NRRL F-5122]KUJ34177.1 hypothetical protein ADL25_42425 [Streptomyces sp. NRRL F-5122]
MTAAAARVGRFYTSARRHPWVLGKVADWKIPLGPYTPAQIAVAVGGGFLLVKTIGWWSWMGPLPIVAWLLAIWAVRQPKIRGRAPMQATLGWVMLGWQPRGGRIGGHAARDRAPRPLSGSFTIEGDPVTGHAPQAGPSNPAGQALHPSPDAGRPSAPNNTQPVPLTLSVGPVSGVQQLLAFAQQGEAR